MFRFFSVLKEHPIGGIDKLHLLVAHVLQFPEEGIHIAVFAFGEDIVDGEASALFQRK